MKSTPVVKPLLTSNWGDQLGYPVARMLLPFVERFKVVTPNHVTLFSFALFVAGCVFLFVDIPFHQLLSAVLIVAGYVGDDLDGQLARSRNLSSPIGDYLDKTLDVLKIYTLTASLGYATYLQTENPAMIFLAFTACFFFNFRYYIKLETMFSRINDDPQYLVKSAKKKVEVLAHYEADAAHSHDSFAHRLKILWIRNRTFFAVDEAEFALITAFCVLIGQLDIALICIATTQVCIGFWRLYQRGRQIHAHPEDLLLPLRK
jgi:hypothetical protein